MRIFHVTMIIRLLLLSIYPAIALAADPVNEITLQNINENIITDESQLVSQEELEKKLANRQQFMGNSILKPLSPAEPTDSQVEANNKRIKLFQSRLDSYNPPQGEVTIMVTGYSSTVDQCDGDPFTTASGTRVHKGTLACPPQYPFGTKIKIEGKGTFICEDRGGAIKGNHFDMWFSTRQEAKEWGKRTVAANITK